MHKILCVSGLITYYYSVGGYLFYAFGQYIRALAIANYIHALAIVDYWYVTAIYVYILSTINLKFSHESYPWTF